MTNLKPFVASILALSITGAAFAANGQVVQQQPQQARTNQNSSSNPLDRALAGNSYEGYIPHHYIRGMQGIWIGGFGQVVGSYSNNYLLIPGTDASQYEYGTTPTTAGTPVTADTNATIGLNHADLLVGYDSNNAGFLVDYGYSRAPEYTSTSTIGLEDGTLNVNEAYMTYKFNNMFAVKAGQFNSDFGSYDPTQPIQTMVNAIDELQFSTAQNVAGAFNKSAVTGGEVVFASNGFHGSAAGVMGNAKTATLTNNAKPTSLILNGGYDMPFKGATVGFQGSYVHQGGSVNTSAWTAGAHYANDKLTVKADLYNYRTKDADGKTPWFYSGTVDYKLNTQMTVGGYGDYLHNPGVLPYHWTLGAKFGYAVNRYANADFYVQRQTVTSDASTAGYKDNTSAIVALSVKV